MDFTKDMDELELTKESMKDNNTHKNNSLT